MSKEVKYAPVRTLNSGFAEFLLGLFIGGFLLGPIVWTELGRRLAIEAIRRGAKVTRERIEEWLRKGEEEMK